MALYCAICGWGEVGFDVRDILVVQNILLGLVFLRKSGAEFRDGSCNSLDLPWEYILIQTPLLHNSTFPVLSEVIEPFFPCKHLIVRWTEKSTMEELIQSLGKQ